MNYLLTICLLFSLTASAQYDWTPGKIYMNNGKTYQGLVKIPQGTGIRLATPKVKFKKNKDAKRKKFKDFKIEKVMVHTESGEDQEFRMMPLNKRRKRLFHIIVDGKTKLYERKLQGKSPVPIAGGGPPMAGSVMLIGTGKEILVLKKGAKKPKDLLEANWFKSFKAYATDYFSDCPSLVKKLENETYTQKDMKQIVIDYNQCQ